MCLRNVLVRVSMLLPNIFIGVLICLGNIRVGNNVLTDHTYRCPNDECDYETYFLGVSMCLYNMLVDVAMCLRDTLVGVSM